MIALFAEAKAWLIAIAIGAAAAAVGILALMLHSARGQATALKTQRDDALRRAANATTARRVAASAQRAAEDAQAEIARKPPINPDVPDDFEGRW